MALILVPPAERREQTFPAKFCCPGVGLSTDFHRIIGDWTMSPVFHCKTG
jgi:hypothetical protein